MDYNDRFKAKTVKSKKFTSYSNDAAESDMIEWINENIDDIEIVQVYTALDNTYFHTNDEVRTCFYCMYKNKEKILI